MKEKKRRGKDIVINTWIWWEKSHKGKKTGQSICMMTVSGSRHKYTTKNVALMPILWRVSKNLKTKWYKMNSKNTMILSMILKNTMAKLLGAQTYTLYIWSVPYSSCKHKLKCRLADVSEIMKLGKITSRCSSCIIVHQSRGAMSTANKSNYTYLEKACQQDQFHGLSLAVNSAKWQVLFFPQAAWSCTILFWLKK